MYAKALILAVSLLAAAPAFAATAKAKASDTAAASDHTGPIPYSELAAADAKLNAAPTTHKARRHVAKKAAAPADAAAPASAPASK